MGRAYGIVLVVHARKSATGGRCKEFVGSAREWREIPALIRGAIGIWEQLVFCSDWYFDAMRAPVRSMCSYGCVANSNNLEHLRHC